MKIVGAPLGYGALRRPHAHDMDELAVGGALPLGPPSSLELRRLVLVLGLSTPGWARRWGTGICRIRTMTHPILPAIWACVTRWSMPRGQSRQCALDWLPTRRLSKGSLGLLRLITSGVGATPCVRMPTSSRTTIPAIRCSLLTGVLRRATSVRVGEAHPSTLAQRGMPVLMSWCSTRTLGVRA